MDSEKLITIVVPVRDRAGLISRTLDSIAAQTNRDFKLIIVDNASNDTTPDVIALWQKQHCNCGFDIEILTEPTVGASAARNRGLAAVATPYVMFFDSDDEMRPQHIANIITYLHQRPDTGLLRWDVAIIDDDGWLTVKAQRFHDELQLHLLHGTLSTVRYIVRTDILRETGGWNERLSTWDDLELGIRLLKTNAKVRKLHGEPTVTIHPTGNSISGRNYSERLQQITAALDTIGSYLNDDTDPQALYIATLDAKRAIVAAHLHREGNHEAAATMMQTALKGHNFRQRMALRAVTTVTRWLGRGGAATALLLFGKKAEKR